MTDHRAAQIAITIARRKCAANVRLYPRPVIFLFRPVIAAAQARQSDGAVSPFIVSLKQLSGMLAMAGCTPAPVSFLKLTGKNRRERRERPSAPAAAARCRSAA